MADDRVVRPTSIRIADGGGQSARELVLEAGTGVTFATELVDGRLVVTFSAAGGSGTPATSVESETSFGVAAAVGSSTNYARQDHTHGSPTAPTAASVGADAAGTSAAGIEAHVAAGDPHPAYALEAALGTASALNAAATRASGGLLKLGTNLLYGLDALAALDGFHVSETLSGNGAYVSRGWAAPSVSGSTGSQSNGRWNRHTGAAQTAWWLASGRLCDRNEGFVAVICFKIPTTIGSRRMWIGLCSTTPADSDTPSGHFVGLRYSSTAGDAGFVPASRDGATTTIGSAFAAPVVDVPYICVLTGTAGGSVVVELIRGDTGTREVATISATLPAAGTKVDWALYSWNQAVSKALEFAYARRYLPLL